MNTITFVEEFCRLQDAAEGGMLTTNDAPLVLAAKEHAAQRGPRSFMDDVCAHLLHGVVWSGPHSFALARPVRTSDAPAALNDPGKVSHDPDCWWLYLLAGNWADAVGHLPYYLPYIGWERRGKPRFHLTTTIVKAYDRSLSRKRSEDAESRSAAARSD